MLDGVEKCRRMTIECIGSIFDGTIDHWMLCMNINKENECKSKILALFIERASRMREKERALQFLYILAF